MKLWAVTTIGAVTAATMGAGANFHVSTPPADDQAAAAVEDFAAWLESTEDTSTEWNFLTHPACVIDDDGAAICYGLGPEGFAVAFSAPPDDDGG